ncbi:MAG: electron transfer flavoprotein subunit beta/FixA family protein [Elusimicrobia bacterium]|nr:electron transfer flavoprotein subunit beta/FixA family protein [Elusimicrobiota bacterium]
MPLNIIVCVKQTPATANIQIDSHTGLLKSDGVNWGINPFDEYAIEEGIRLKERIPGSWCGALTLGLPRSEEVLREAIARGCDEAFHICGQEFDGSDTFATSYALHKGIQKLIQTKGKIDLILCGKQTNDGDAGQVGPGIAAWLDWPSVSYVKKIEEVNEKQVKIHRMMEDGSDILEVSLPAVLSVVKEINEPRLPSLKGKMASKKAVISKWNAEELGCDRSKVGLQGSPTVVAKRFLPPSRPQGTRLDGATIEDKAKKLVEKLKEHKLI